MLLKRENSIMIINFSAPLLFRLDPVVCARARLMIVVREETTDIVAVLMATLANLIVLGGTLR